MSGIFSQIIVSGRYRILCLLFLSIFCTGCVYTNHIRLDDERQRMIMEDQSDRGSARLFVAGESIELESLKIQRDTIRYIPESDGEVYAVHVDSITKYQYKNHLNGAIEGVGFGFMTAGLAGGLFTLINRERSYVGPVITGFLTGIAGGIAGLPVGAAIGTTYIYLPPKK